MLNAPCPTAVLSVPSVKVSAVLYPIRTLLSPSVTAVPALSPSITFALPPDSIPAPAFRPIRTLLLPAVGVDTD